MGDEVVCAHCGHRNQTDANFCSSCGQAIVRADDNPTQTIQLDAAADAHSAEIDLADVPPDGAVLTVVRGPNVGSRFVLDKDVITAGRHPDSDIFLDDITVSRRHAEVSRRGGAWVVRDVGSLNGTYVNRDRIDETPLDDGDELQVGKFKLSFALGRPGNR